jgi:putative ABC transport system permease protein
MGKEMYSIVKFTDAEYLPTYGCRWRQAGISCPIPPMNSWFQKTSWSKLGISRPEDAVNKDMSLFGGFLKGKIVGVLKDFHSTGFKDKYSRVIMVPFKRAYDKAGIKLTSGNPATTLAAIEKLWNQTFPNYVFEYKFLDDSIETFYRQEKQQAELYKIFAAIAIFLGCLGLYGLASFMALQRTREVGIRKVLGASIQNIIYLFTREFAVLIHCLPHRCSDRLVFYAPLAAGLCFPPAHHLVDLFGRRRRFTHRRTDNDQLNAMKAARPTR